jgi:glutamate 5-kinase
MHLKNSKIIVIKIGSSLLVDKIKKLEKNGYQVLQKIFKN